jgi:hypothetical protein
MAHSPDFLQSNNGSVVTVRPRRWLLRSVLVLLLVVVVGVVFVRPVKQSLRAWEFANQGKAALTEAEAYGLELDFAGADKALGEAVTQFDQARTALKKTSVLRFLPWLGRQIQATEAILVVGVDTIGAAREMLAFGNDLSGVLNDIESTRRVLTPELDPTVTFRTLAAAEKRLILARFLASIPKLEAARIQVSDALKRFETIPTDGLAGPLRSAIAPVAASLPRLSDDLDRAIPIAKLLPAFAGYPAQKQTLILFLNNAELRPGGGFVGTVGRMSVHNATVQSLITKDAYHVDQPSEAFLNIEPPAPLTDYLGLTRWFMRDANWSPDFKHAAELVTHFYERETSGGEAVEEINNVIGFTPTFASKLLAITGPLLVDNQTFRADNLFDLLEYQVEQGFTERGVPFSQRKEILADLVNVTMDALFNLPLSRLEEVLAALDEGFREKQLMLYDRDTEIQAHIEAQGWGGRVHAGEGDFVKVVDANLGSLKSDPVVRRRITYTIAPEGDEYQGTVAITYRHEGHFDWKTTRYRTYTRVYVPEGSTFISTEGTLQDDKIKNPVRAPGDVTVEQDPEIPGTVSFGAFTAIEPGEERTLSFTYQLAPKVAKEILGGAYRLQVQKQLGAAAYELTLDLDFGKKGDEPFQTRTDLSEDRVFTVNP